MTFIQTETVAERQPSSKEFIADIVACLSRRNPERQRHSQGLLGSARPLSMDAILNGAAACEARYSGENMGSGSECNTSIRYLPKSCCGG